MHPSTPRSLTARARATLVLPMLAAPALAVAQGPAVRVASDASARAERVDTAAIRRLEDEGMNRSQVMELVSWLTDVHGARLTGSPQTRAAAEWAVKTMTSWGVTNARLESWGYFGRGWTNERVALHAVTPTPWSVLAYPSAWTPGTDGPVTADAVLVQIDSEPDFARYHGTLRGKLALVGRPLDLPAHFTAQGERYTEAELDEMGKAAAPAPGGQGGGRPAVDASRMTPEQRARLQAQQLAPRRLRFLAEEGVAGILLPGRGDDGTVFVSSTGGSRDTVATPMAPTVVLAAEHYGRLARALDKGVPVQLELDVRNRFHDADRTSFNILGELPGTDRKLKDEVVMLGAHFDSWHAGTGATDNAAGVAVMMEAMRLLKASGVPLKRTVRIALWTGEEQGLLGSRAYVAQHLGDRATMALKPEHAKVSAYFNLDNGTGKIRGIYAQGNAAVAPVFGQWLAPFASGGAHTVTLRNTTGTDHLAFDGIGVPGFQFIQDAIEYGTRTHHSNMDLFERVQADDMKWNAVVVAAFVLQTANRDERLPRKPLPTGTPRPTASAASTGR